MVVYLRGSDLKDYHQEIIREDVIELILDGQERGDDIQKVMGSRYKEICDEIIEVMPKKTKKDKIIEFAGTALDGLSILGLIALIKSLIESLISKSAEFNFVLTVGNLISWLAIILIANAIIWFITKTAFDTKNDNKIVSFIRIWIIAAGLSIVVIAPNIFIKIVALSVPLWLAAIFVLFIFVFGKIVDKIA